MSPSAVLDKEQLRDLVAETLDVPAEEVTDEADFAEDLGVDSLMALEVMVVMERRYGVKLDESRLREVTCFDRAYRMLAEKLAGGPA